MNTNRLCDSVKKGKKYHQEKIAGHTIAHMLTMAFREAQHRNSLPRLAVQTNSNTITSNNSFKISGSSTLRSGIVDTNIQAPVSSQNTLSASSTLAVVAPGSSSLAYIQSNYNDNTLDTSVHSQNAIAGTNTVKLGQSKSVPLKGSGITRAQYKHVPQLSATDEYLLHTAGISKDDLIKATSGGDGYSSSELRAPSDVAEANIDTLETWDDNDRGFGFDNDMMYYDNDYFDESENNIANANDNDNDSKFHDHYATDFKDDDNNQHRETYDAGNVFKPSPIAPIGNDDNTSYNQHNKTGVQKEIRNGKNKQSHHDKYDIELSVTQTATAQSGNANSVIINHHYQNSDTFVENPYYNTVTEMISMENQFDPNLDPFRQQQRARSDDAVVTRSSIANVDFSQDDKFNHRRKVNFNDSILNSQQKRQHVPLQLAKNTFANSNTGDNLVNIPKSKTSIAIERVKKHVNVDVSEDYGSKDIKHNLSIVSELTEPQDSKRESIEINDNAYIIENLHDRTYNHNHNDNHGKDNCKPSIEDKESLSLRQKRKLKRANGVNNMAARASVFLKRKMSFGTMRNTHGRILMNRLKASNTIFVERRIDDINTDQVKKSKHKKTKLSQSSYAKHKNENALGISANRSGSGNNTDSDGCSSPCSTNTSLSQTCSTASGKVKLNQTNAVETNRENYKSYKTTLATTTTTTVQKLNSNDVKNDEISIDSNIQSCMNEKRQMI